MGRDERTGHREFDLRRLAAVDMHALSGSDARRRVIVAEFVLGVLASAGIGIFLLLSSDEPLAVALGLYTLGVGANYLPLAYHALTLRSRQRLAAAVAELDLAAELRYYTRSQFLVFVPLIFIWFALRGARSTAS